MSELTRVLIFAVIGVTNSLIDVFIFYSLVRIFNKSYKPAKKKGISPATIFHCISFLIANVNSFFLNSFFTFADSKKDNPSWFLYFSVSMVTLAFSASFIQIFSREKFYTYFKNAFSKKYNLSVNNWYMILKIVSIGIGMFINYFGYKLIVF